MFSLNCKGKLLIAEQPLVMGIINITPDSFYSSSRFINKGDILKQAAKMLEEGAAILDIGGQSTRPGAEQLSIDEEAGRVIPAIELIHQQFPEAILSVDSYHSQIVIQAVSAGASIVNDITAGNGDELMFETVSRLNVPYICMHMKGDPRNMQRNPVYDNVITELLDFFIRKKNECNKAGIKDIILDPGFGFGKTIHHNFEILNHFDSFKILDCPLMIGVSRKSTIYKTLGVSVQEALNGTTVLNTIGLLKGAGILRVHDVKEAREAVKLISTIGNSY
ncbi:MAG TPA: dihydropteroate synthase [Puia sp.]|nr:dihydropteroate synthase [Puia sp.]